MWIFRIIEILQDLVILKKEIIFNWYYDEEDVKEAGLDLANLLNIDMNFFKK